MAEEDAEFAGFGHGEFLQTREDGQIIRQFADIFVLSYRHFHLKEQALYERILLSMREKIRTRQYVMTVHANDEMEDDGLTIFDVESVILTGKIIERQKDSATGEWKYLCEGQTLNGAEVIVAGKISVVNKLVLITVYRS